MRVEIITHDDKKHEGIVALRDESFIVLKNDSLVDIIHWDKVKELFSIKRETKKELFIENFKKIRE